LREKKKEKPHKYLPTSTQKKKSNKIKQKKERKKETQILTNYNK
jgi:hypothetical protein